MILKECVKFHFGTKFSSIFLLHGKHSCGKVLNEVWYQACLSMPSNTYLYFASNKWVPSFARCRLTNDSGKTKRFSPFARKMLLNLVAKNKFCTLFHIIIWTLMAISSWLELIQVYFDFIWIVSCSWSNHMKLLLMFVAEKVLLLLVISLTEQSPF